MKITPFLDVTGPQLDDSFMFVLTGANGACAYYTMPRSEANLLLDVLRRGTEEWWDEQAASVQPYQKPDIYGWHELEPIEAFDDAYVQGRDHGDENDAAR